MQLSFRWYGEDDPIPLEYIRQIPGMSGIVTAIYDIPVGEAWPLEKIITLKQTIEEAGLEISVIESVPVHEDIKLGKPSRDQYIKNYQETIENLGAVGIKVICYNFMPVFDWTRSDLNYLLADGSTALIFDNDKIKKMNSLSGELSLPGWDTSYTVENLVSLFEEYKLVDEEILWENLSYFLNKIIPTAEASDVKMAIHPDDPPWPIFGLPRIITNQVNLERLINLYDSPYNGLTMCSGSLGVDPDNNYIEMLGYFLEKKRVNFIHSRNVKITGTNSFEETAHLSECGHIDMYEVVRQMVKHGYTGAMRPDHGRMIWGETGKPGYGLYDRALGATYLNGLYEAVIKNQFKSKEQVND